MLERTIINYHDLEVKLSDHADKGILDILDHAVRGAEGGLRFSLRNIGKRIEAYGDKVRFLSIYRKNKITGTAGACFQVTGQGLLRYPSTYIKYLAFLSSYQTNIKRNKKEVTLIKHDDNDSFKQKTLELFGKPHILELPDVFEEDKHILYAFVESMNERSKNIVNQAGFEYIRSFLTVAFSRFNPNKDSRVEKLSKGDKKVMRQLVRDYYFNHSFFNDDHLYEGDNYYVLKEGDEIIAGVWALPTEYKVYDLPGVWGWVLKKVVPSLPLYRRLFPSEVFKCLVFDAVYCRNGYESELSALFSSILADEGLFTGLMWLDDHSDLYSKMRSEVKLGPLNRILNAKPGLVYAKFINFPEADKEIFYDSPAYISGFDFS